jgi:hypothetical protein
MGCEALISGKSAWQVRQYSGWPVRVGINSTGLGWREFHHQRKRMVRRKMKEERARMRRMGKR